MDMNQDQPMTIINILDMLITKAMKENDKDMLSIYRLAKTEMVKAQKSNEHGVIDQDTVFKTMRKHLKEEVESLEKAGRDTSLQNKHIEWITSMLPKPVTEEDIRLDLSSWLPEQPEHCKNIGFVMQHLKLVFHGKDLDGKLASRIAKEMLENQGH